MQRIGREMMIKRVQPCWSAKDPKKQSDVVTVPVVQHQSESSNRSLNEDPKLLHLPMNIVK